jgi:hypothetical protein
MAAPRRVVRKTLGGERSDAEGDISCRRSSRKPFSTDVCFSKSTQAACVWMLTGSWLASTSDASLLVGEGVL